MRSFAIRLASVVVLAACFVPLEAAAQQESAGAALGDAFEPPESPAPPSNAAPVTVQVVGSPRWTQTRSFTTARAWVLDTGTQDLELWYQAHFHRFGVTGENEYLWQLEYSMGVAHRIQVDAYFNYAKDADGYHYAGTAVEGRFAFPDHYGEIWGNPVLYLEAQSLQGGPLRGEAKLLLSGALFSSRWHGAVNLFAEQNLNAARKGEPFEADRELGVSAAMNYMLIRDYLALGAESMAARDQEGGTTYQTWAEAGPSLWASFWPGGLRVALTGLFGLTEHSDRVHLLSVVGMKM